MDYANFDMFKLLRGLLLRFVYEVFKLLYGLNRFCIFYVVFYDLAEKYEVYYYL